MSIEQSGAASGSKPVAPHAARQGHGRSPGQAQGAGGFAAMLLTLGADELVPGEEQGQAGRGKMVLLGDADPLAMHGVASDIGEPQGGFDAATALALAGFLPKAAGDAAVSSRGEADAAAEGALGLSGERAGRKPLAGTARSAQSEDQPGSGELKAPDARTEPAEGLAATAKGAQSAQKQVALAQQRVSDRLQAAEVAAQTVREQVLRAGEAHARVALHTAEPSVKVGDAPTLVPILVGETGLRQTERRIEKAAQRQSGSEMGAWGGPVHADGLRSDAAVVTGTPGAFAQMQVAEQVSYWIGRGVQNAELELAGLGEGAVKVSIALQGQEAHVDFQADQAQTRQLLEDSLPHLRDLLQREGLVLGGVSVGNSGAQGQGGKQPQDRSGARQATVAVTELQAQAPRAGGGTPSVSGRALDLFV